MGLTLEIERISKMMEEMANAPKEEMGERQPGEYQAREIYPKFAKHEVLKIIRETQIEQGEYNNPERNDGFELFRSKIYKKICEA